MKEASTVLEGYGIEDSGKEAEIIFTQCLGFERVALYRDNPLLSPPQLEALKKILERRRRREPLQYIIGHTDFYGLTIKVGPGVLIPRPETEIVVEEVRETVKGRQSQVFRQSLRDQGQSTTEKGLKILDLCTGSGCLALALAKEFPKASVIGTDISEVALGYARQNSQINGIKNVTFLKGSLFEPLGGMQFDIVVSNPPYIRRNEMEGLQREISEWEPMEALDGGEDGLRFYREILLGSRGYVKGDGFIVMEMGDGESGDVAAMARNLGFRNISVRKDYSAMERVLRIAL